MVEILFVALAAILVLAPLVYLMHENVTVGFVLLALAWLPEVLFQGGSPARVQVAGIQVLASDGIAVAALAASLLNHTRNRWLWAAFGFACVALGRGVMIYGGQPAFNEFRSLFGFLTAALYLASRSQHALSLGAILRWWVGLGSLLAVFATIHWTRHGIGSSSGAILISGETVDSRALPAAGALVVAQAALFLVLFPRLIRHRMSVMLVLWIVTVLLQHRSVWIALFSALLFYILIHRSNRGRRLAWSVMGVAGIVAGFVAMILAPDEVRNSLSTSYRAMFAEDSTFQWRLTSWQALIAQDRSFVDWLIGQPFGRGYTRFMDGVLVSVQPHSFYVQAAVSLGLVGALLLIACYVSTWKDISRSAVPELTVILATQAVFFVSYGPSMLQGALLGLGIWAARLAPSQCEVRSTIGPASREDDPRAIANSGPAWG